MAAALALAFGAPSVGPPSVSVAGAESSVREAEAIASEADVAFKDADYKLYPWGWGVDEAGMSAAKGKYLSAYRKLAQREYPDGQAPSNDPAARALWERIRYQIEECKEKAK